VAGTPEFLNSPELGTPKVPLSHAVKAGDLIYLAGQIGISPQTGALAGPGVTEQTRQVLENLSSVLKACGKSFGDVVKANVYLIDMGDFAAMNEVYKQYLSEPYPARTALAVKALPQGAVVEIEMIAAA
jgi:2-iminobutanoate/2-iminopropanoate deaminase